MSRNFKHITTNIRDATRDDWFEILAIHRRAVHELTTSWYSRSTRNAWAPLIEEAKRQKYLEEFDQKKSQGQIILVAIVDGYIAGFGELDPRHSELMAMYIKPDFSRQGIGTAIHVELEQRAQSLNLSTLHLKASLAAVPFYLHLGYLWIADTMHILNSGESIHCVQMKKHL